jgi:hypothetical protein
VHKAVRSGRFHRRMRLKKHAHCRLPKQILKHRDNFTLCRQHRPLYVLERKSG